MSKASTLPPLWFCGGNSCVVIAVTHRGRMKEEAADVFVLFVLERLILSDDVGVAFVVHSLMDPTIIYGKPQNGEWVMTKYHILSEPTPPQPVPPPSGPVAFTQHYLLS